MTEIHRRVLRANGPALLFENPVDSESCACHMPVFTNLFGTAEHIALGLGVPIEQLDKLGEMLAFLRQPLPPNDMQQVIETMPAQAASWNGRT